MLLAGGDDTGDPPYRTAEIFQPASRTYVGAGTMRVKRAGHTATPSERMSPSLTEASVAIGPAETVARAGGRHGAAAATGRRSNVARTCGRLSG